MGLICKPRPTAPKEATRVSGPWEYGCLSCVGKRRGLEEAIECVKGGVPLHVVAAEFSMAWVSHGKGLTSLRQQLKLDQDRRSFGPEGPEGLGAMGAFRDGEEPLRGSQMARRLLEGAGVQVVGRVQRPRDRGP